MKKFFKIFAALVGIVILLVVITFVAIYSQKDKIEGKVQASLTKVRQSEPKVVLSSLYTMQKMFYAEFGSYTSAVTGLDQPYGIQPVRYKYGFANEIAPEKNRLMQIKATAPHFDPTKTNLDKYGVWPQHEASKSLKFEDLAKAHGCEVSKTTFKLCGIGYPADNSKLDIWTMDQDRNLVHVQDALE